MRIFFFLLLLLCLTGGTATAQVLEWQLNLHTFVDNREYMKSERFSQTIFGTRLAPEIGLQLDSVHRVRGGFNALYEFGSRDFTTEIKPVLYYQYDTRNWDFYAGVFPRFGLLSDYPRALLADTLQYFRPNVEGLLARYENDFLQETAWIDWTSRQTAVDRETFIFGLSGTLHRGIFFLSHYAMMFHNAGPAIRLPDDHVQDNGAAAVKLGLDLSHRFIFDSLTINTGGIMSFERTRDVGGWSLPKGALLEFHARYKSVALTNSWYKGEGHNLLLGDRFYTAKNYNRLDLSWAPIQYRKIEGAFTFSFHFLENVIDSQQAFSLRYRLDGSKPVRLKL
ncbi:hypothetical protein [Botryobacter ruber]|uniref:hypothetical protein n=1 Tax=Botryobacter ruber TaxID=2171629 RepID=UPI000E0C20E4|nr:hypothetical protein [Botryobacter ruber]